MSRTRLAALTLTAATLAASGCGGSTKSSSHSEPSALAQPPASSQSPTQSAPLTRAELIAKADAICRRVNAQRAASTLKSQQDFARLLPPLAGYEQAAVAELSKLTPPAQMENDWQQIVVGLKTVATDTAKVGEYAKENNSKGAYPFLSMGTTAERQTLAIAKRDGFKDCARVA